MFNLFDRDFFRFFMGFMLILIVSFAVFLFSAELSSNSKESTAATIEATN